MHIEELTTQDDTSSSKNLICLNLESNLASKKIMLKISSFSSQMKDKFTSEQKKEFNKYIKRFLNWLELNEDSIKGHMSDSLAQVILYLVSSKIGISKKDFIANLKPNVKTNRNKPKVENIKKLLCYPM